MVAAMGCADRTIGPIGPSSIPFDLTIPSNRPVADYYAVSGVTTSTTFLRIADSIVQSQVLNFYAQFTATPGLALPASVLLNDNRLERNLDTDTLRLDEITTGNVLKDNDWTFVGADSTKKKITMPAIDIVDSVGPFQSRTSFRSDAPLTVGWRIPHAGAGGLTIIWRGPEHTTILPVNDFIGTATIPEGEMEKLLGAGTVTFIRYTNRTDTFNGKSITVTRIAQHSYPVTVQ